MQLFSLPELMPVTPEFNLGAIMSVTLIFLVSATETIGDYSALTMVAPAPRAHGEGALGRHRRPTVSSARCRRASAASPITSFSQNVGLVAMTGVVNRRAIATGAVIWCSPAFLPVISLMFASLPEAVLGGCTIMMFGNIIVSGFQMIATPGFSQRNITIAALSLAVGIGFTQMGDPLRDLPRAGAERVRRTTAWPWCSWWPLWRACFCPKIRRWRGRSSWRRATIRWMLPQTR